MLYVKNTMNLEEKQKLEVAGMNIAEQANEQEKQAAVLDYIAMMANVDLSPVTEEESEEEVMPYEE